MQRLSFTHGAESSKHQTFSRLRCHNLVSVVGGGLLKGSTLFSKTVSNNQQQQEAKKDYLLEKPIGII